MSDGAQPRERPLWHAFVTLALVLLLAAGLTYGVVGVMLPPPAPVAMTSQPLSNKALTEHLLFVVVDGLRYDVGTDPQRMPKFAAAMKRHASGEIWAGRVSMTSSAVLTYGTGQRGTLEQVVRNIHIAPSPFNSWLANAKAAGLRIAAVGDASWHELYTDAIELQRPDPVGVAIDVDFNPQTFRDTRALAALKPNVLIAHFVTPDHQAHAYGVHSQRYRDHIRSYDTQLAELLGEFSDDWTVIVTSDHGAADTGTHGSDEPLQRRSPIYAYGPGITAAKTTAKLDQADLPATLALLLGVAPPAHSRGHLLNAFVDMPAAELAEAGCNNARRGLSYGVASYGTEPLALAATALAECGGSADPAAKIAAATTVVRRVDAVVVANTGLASRGALWVTACTALLALLIGLWTFGRAGAGSVLRLVPSALLLVALGVWLTYGVERLHGHMPNIVRGLLFVVVNGMALAILLRPGAWARWAERWRRAALLLVPGLLLASYTANTHPESFVVVVVVGLLALLKGPIDGDTEALWRGALRDERRLRWLGFVLGIGILVFPGVQTRSLYPQWLADDAAAMTASGIVGLLAWAGLRLALRRRNSAAGTTFTPAWILGLGLMLALAGMVARPWLNPWLGRGLVLAALLLAGWGMACGRIELALLAGLVGYGVISRPLELLPLAGALLVAQAVGRALAQGGRRSNQPWSWAQTLLAVVFGFALLYVLRIGLTGQLDFGGLDFQAGAFGDAQVSAAMIGVALGLKYLFADALVLVVLLGPFVRARQIQLAKALLLTHVARAALLTCMLYFCGGSYWTALRVMGDLPFALVPAVVCALLWIAFYAAGDSAAVEVAT